MRDGSAAKRPFTSSRLAASFLDAASNATKAKRSLQDRAVSKAGAGDLLLLRFTVAQHATSLNRVAASHPEPWLPGSLAEPPRAPLRTLGAAPEPAFQTPFERQAHLRRASRQGRDMHAAAAPRMEPARTTAEKQRNARSFSMPERLSAARPINIPRRSPRGRRARFPCTCVTCRGQSAASWRPPGRG
jgi:hypothetical protein